MGFWHTMVEVFPRFMPVLLDGAVIAVALNTATAAMSALFIQRLPVRSRGHILARGCIGLSG